MIVVAPLEGSWTLEQSLRLQAPCPATNPIMPIGQGLGTVKTVPYRTNYNGQHTLKQSVGRGDPTQ